MVDKLKPGSPQWFKRQRCYHHNAFFGHVGMTKANMNSIIESSTTTHEAKEIAQKIFNLASILAEQLKVRVDPK